MTMRAKILLLISMVFLTSGLNILCSKVPASWVALDPSVHAHLRLMTVGQIGALFTGLGAAGVLAAAFRRTTFGFLLFMFVSVFWGLLYLLSWQETGEWRCVFGAVQYAFLAGVMLASSGVVELDKKFLTHFDPESPAEPLTHPEEVL